jgi:hypothetical protein
MSKRDDNRKKILIILFIGVVFVIFFIFYHSKYLIDNTADVNNSAITEVNINTKERPSYQEYQQSSRYDENRIKRDDI